MLYYTIAKHLTLQIFFFYFLIVEYFVDCFQAKGIRVLLSIGGPPESSDYSLTSTEDAKSVANYLYTNFLRGQYGPLGSITLDGIDFDIQTTEHHWEDLATELDTLRRTNHHRYFFLSAAPQCSIPAPFLHKAINRPLRVRPHSVLQ